MDAQARSRWRWAWFCPRCGAHNAAAAEGCDECGLEHALLNAPGPSGVHACGVASPGWAAFCIGCGDDLAEGVSASENVGTADAIPAEPRAGRMEPRGETAEPARRPRRPHKILPPKDGPAEGLTLTRHVLLEREAGNRSRAAPFRLASLIVVAALAVLLLLRLLATPGDGLFGPLRAHQLPGRGFDALVLLEGMHRLLAPSSGQTGAPSWTLTVNRAEIARTTSGSRLVLVRLEVRNSGTMAGKLTPQDVHLVDANGLDLTASEASAAIARAAGLAPLGDLVAAGGDLATLVAFEPGTEPREPRLKVPGAEAPLHISSS